MLKESESWKYRDSIINHFKEMMSDKIFKAILVSSKRRYMKEDCREFYDTVQGLAEERNAI